ncbi:hypothetical protein [Nonomuraea sp. GTA35]
MLAVGLACVRRLPVGRWLSLERWLSLGRGTLGYAPVRRLPLRLV